MTDEIEILQAMALHIILATSITDGTDALTTCPELAPMRAMEVAFTLALTHPQWVQAFMLRLQPLLMRHDQDTDKAAMEQYMTGIVNRFPMAVRQSQRRTG